jgi:NodT family efflux transporter outer membrane factor (OMF) lipoprotein
MLSLAPMNRAHQLAALVCCLLGTVSCTQVGPDFTEPEVAMASEWELYDSSALNTVPDATVEWWQIFNDPVLDELVVAAYAQNLGLEAAGLRVLEARAQLGIAVGQLFPQQQAAGGGASFTSQSDRSTNPTGPDQSFWTYDLGFNVGWEIDFWGRFQRGIESADASLMSTVAAYDAALLLLTAQVVDTYAVIRATEAQLMIARENVALQQRSFEITDTLFRNGQESELDKQQALTLRLSTEATIPQLETTLDRARNALAILLGQMPGSINQRIGETGIIPIVPNEVAVGIPADLLRRRPDVRQALLQAATQSALIGVATADLYPTFTLTGTIGLVSTSGLDTGNDGDTLQFSGGPAFNWQLFNYGRLKNNIRVQDARFQQTLVNYQNTVLIAAREVEDSITGFVRGRTQNEILELTVISARRSADIAMLRYQEGFSGYQRVLDAQQSLFAQQKRSTDSHSNTVRSLIALYKALGGGWEIRQGQEFVDAKTLQEMTLRTDWGRLLNVEAVTAPDKTNKAVPSPDW